MIDQVFLKDLRVKYGLKFQENLRQLGTNSIFHNTRYREGFRGKEFMVWRNSEEELLLLIDYCLCGTSEKDAGSEDESIIL